MKTLLRLAAVLLVATAAQSADLFTNRKPIEFRKYSPLQADATIGGYAIYRANHTWLISDLKTADSGSDEYADRIDFGQATFVTSTPHGSWLATMGLTVNLSGASSHQWFTGTPCAGTHIASINKSVAVWDNCLTLNVRESQSNGKAFPYLELIATQSQSAGRSYRLFLALSLDELGFESTSASQWSPAAIAADPRKKEFIQRTLKWAELLQNGTNAAIAFNKPTDVFQNVPPITSLADIPGSTPAQ